MKISQVGIDLVKQFESLHDGDLTQIGLQPKLCPAGIVTIGYGHALTIPGNGWLLKTKDVAKYYPQYVTIDETMAEDLLEKDLETFENGVNSLGIYFTQNQFDALVSFSFNVGFHALLASTLLKRIKSGTGDIKEAFLMWNKCKGKVLRGLTLRREAEANLYLS